MGDEKVKCISGSALIFSEVQRGEGLATVGIASSQRCRVPAFSASLGLLLPTSILSITPQMCLSDIVHWVLGSGSTRMNS